MRHHAGSACQRQRGVGGSGNREAGIVPAVRSLAVLLIAGAVSVGCGPADGRARLESRVQRYVDMWNTADFEGIETLLTEDFELHESPGFEPTGGIDNFRKTLLASHRSYPDFYLTVEEAIYGDDRVAVIWTIRATNTGTGPRPPTGKRVEVTGMSVIHFRDGRISDEWIAGNEFEWYRQLGYELVPARDTGSM